MFGLFKKSKLIDSGIINGMTDWHSHILPGVDDGVSTMKESLEILVFYEELGIKRVFFTPHIMEDYPKNTTESLRQVFTEVLSTYTGPIELNLAAEYMLDRMFEKHLSQGDMLTIYKDCILVESSYAGTFHNVKNIIQHINSNGYFVLLAHPERYVNWRDEELRELRSMKVKFQANLLSFVGYYGNSVKQKSLRLLKDNYFDFIGTDIHNLFSFSKAIKNSSLKKQEMQNIREVIEKSLYLKSVSSNM